MRIFLSILVSFILVLSGYSQQLTQLEKKLDSLKIIKEEYQLKIDNLQKEYSGIEKVVNQIRLDETIGEIYYSVGATYLTKTPDGFEDVIFLPTGNKVKLLDYDKKYYKIIYNGSIGWVLKAALIPETELIKEANRKKAEEYADSLKRAEYNKALAEKNKAAESERIERNKTAEIERIKRNKATENERIERNKTAENERKERIISLTKQYNAAIAEKILNGEIWLGMTSEMAKESRGNPQKNNRSVGSWGVHEQWVYEYAGINLYFENGKLTSWQD